VGDLQEAINAFSHVVELAPNHLAARVSLSALQQQIGRHDEALQALSTGKFEMFTLNFFNFLIYFYIFNCFLLLTFWILLFCVFFYFIYLVS
jgi:uncharacterized membrane protein